MPLSMRQVSTFHLLVPENQHPTLNDIIVFPGYVIF